MIAAGGTAGHVLPALAVADVLRARGVLTTFAGSPGRAEERLVPDAGYELDLFRVSGFPRRPSPALLLALARAGFRGPPPRALVASGLLRGEADEVSAALAARTGLAERARLEEGDWAALLLGG